MARNRYEITLADGYGRELDRLVVQARNLRLALLVSEAVLRGRRAGHGQDAVSASVELLGVYGEDYESEEVWDGDGLLGRFEESPEPGLHSVRHDLHPVQGVDMDAVARLEEFGRGLGEIDTDERS
jgi:hypothetical protein